MALARTTAIALIGMTCAVVDVEADIAPGLPAFVLIGLPDTALAAAQTKGRERYEGYVEALGRRLARGRKLADEVIREPESFLLP